MTDSAKGHAPILAAGGIVLRGKSRPRIAVVRLRGEKAWVLPKGKLLPREHARDAAVREVLEETGHAASIHEFLGSMSYTVEGRVKIVQFWLMRAFGPAVGDLSDDVKAVKWLPLKQAIDILSRTHEKLFLAHVGPIALEAAKNFDRAKPKHESRRSKKRRGLNQPIAPIGHVVAMERKKAGQNGPAKALGNWIGRTAQSMRRAG